MLSPAPRRPRWAGRVLVILSALGAALAAAPQADAASNERNPVRRAPPAAAEPADGAQVIVKFKSLGTLMRAQRVAPGAGVKGPQHASTLAQRTGLALRDGRIIDARMQVVRGDRGITSAALAARLAADPDIEYAVPDRRRYPLALPSDPLFAASPAISPAAGQWYLRAPDATLVSAINAAAAWDITAGSPDIVVADIDTGVVFSHPDLAGKLHPGHDFITHASEAGDGNGRDGDAGDPGDWTSTGECGTSSSAASSTWHGTQTSGLIGAQTNNGLGMAGSGYHVKILPVRVLGKCGGTDSDIIAGMLWAGGVSSVPTINPHPARVLNLSLGGPGPCDAAYQDAVRRLNAAGVVVVASAGNDEGFAVGVPANCPGVIAVGGVRHAGTKVGFSSLGPEVAISAPAGNCVNLSGTCLYPILTTTNSGATGPSTNTYSDSDNPSLGTSFAAPLVSGTAALMLSVNPSLTPAQVTTLLKGSARPFPTTSADPEVVQCRAPDLVPQLECLCTSSTCGAGLLDAGAAVAAAAVGTQPTASASASDASVLVGATVTFTGSGLASSGRSIASYQWTITGGSHVASFVTATSTPLARIVTTGAGVVTLQLTVTDSAGQQASASASVTVSVPAAPTVSVLASADVVPAGASVTFDGSGSAAAAGASIASHQWAITSGSTIAHFSSGATAPTAIARTLGNASGAFSVRLTVTDSFGQQSSASRTVQVTPVVPTASIAASALAVAIGTTVQLDGRGSTATTGRSIRSYQWTMVSGGGIASFSGSTGGSSIYVKTSGVGSFTAQLTVTDSAGAKDSKTVTVTVRPSDADRLFAWAEATYGPYFPKPGTAGTYERYTYRYYAATGNYIGIAGGRVYLHNGRDWNLLDVGALSDLLQQAAAAGF